MTFDDLWIQKMSPAAPTALMEIPILSEHDIHLRKTE